MALLELAVTAVDLACPVGAEPLVCEGLHECCPPKVPFRGRVEHRNSQYALYAAACIRGGLQPDLLSDAGWWQTPLWQYDVFTVVIYSRAAAERLAVVEEIARRVAALGTAWSSSRDQLRSRGRMNESLIWPHEPARRDQ